MDFFKSVFADDSDPPSPTSEPESSSISSNPDESKTLIHGSESPQSDSNPTTSSSFGGAWSFGGLIKTLTTKSESVIETYRRDLQEFGSGLRKETDVLRDVASRAVKDLPTSIDIGASKAQVSLESVGQAIDSIGSVVWKSTAEIIAQGKESLIAADLDSDSSDVADNNNTSGNLNAQAASGGRYSRFEAQLRAIQCDLNTYVEKPEDINDYDKWKLGFNLEEQSEEIDGLMKENGNMEGMYKSIVPDSVDHETFWYRYFYRVHRLKQAEFVRASLVKRAISTEDEEELSWDIDDDYDDDKKQDDHSENKEVGDHVSLKEIDKSSIGSSVADDKKDEKKGDIVETVGQKVSNEIEASEENAESNEGESSKKADERDASEGKAEHSESGKDSDISVVSSQPSPEEEDLGWDEIEDIGSGEEKETSQVGSPDRAELRKRLSAAEDDEDLSWDIEDDDEPIKS